MPSPPRGIQKGWLQVHSKESWQRRWCVLLPDAIVYHTDVKSDEEDRLVLGPSVRATPFNDMQAGSCNLSEERPCGFMVSFFSHIRDKWVSAYFDAEDPVTLKKWIRAIETAHWTSSGAHYIDDFSDYSSHRVEKNKTSLPDIDKMNWAAIETVPVHQYATPMAAERHDGMVSAAGIKRATSSSSSAGPKRCETRFEIDDFSDYASDNNAAAETSYSRAGMFRIGLLWCRIAHLGTHPGMKTRDVPRPSWMQLQHPHHARLVFTVLVQWALSLVSVTWTRHRTVQIHAGHSAMVIKPHKV